MATITSVMLPTVLGSERMAVNTLSKGPWNKDSPEGLRFPKKFSKMGTSPRHKCVRQEICPWYSVSCHPDSISDFNILFPCNYQTTLLPVGCWHLQDQILERLHFHIKLSCFCCFPLAFWPCKSHTTTEKKKRATESAEMVWWPP